VKKWAADRVREELGIPGCRSLLRLDKTVRRKGKLPIFETRYYMSSLDPDQVSASRFQDLILGHWEVENCLHLQKDRYYEEDKHVVKGNTWGQTWTVLTNIAVSLTNLLWQGEKTRTLREIREKCHANPHSTAKLLGFA
jgi:predicted transposase YbfD/YdcC